MENKAQRILQLIFQKTYPKDQFGFYTEQMMYEDILRILTNCQIVETPTSTISSKNTRKFRVYFESEFYIRTDEILDGVDIL